ncbi:MAG TPA: hypothetical protein VIQ24_04405 [Pyrinomonadaceae bacterium]
MHKLSRWMPQAPPKRVIPMSIILLAALVVVLVCLAISITAFVVATGLILLVALLGVYDRLRLRRLAERRPGESICTFARSFDRRAVDPWVIRAVYEEFHAYFGGTLPVRAADRIEEDLRMDWEDVDDLLGEVALRSGRSLERSESNPFYGQVRNVGDLVLFLMYQPKRGAA